MRTHKKFHLVNFNRLDSLRLLFSTGGEGSLDTILSLD